MRAMRSAYGASRGACAQPRCHAHLDRARARTSALCDGRDTVVRPAAGCERERLLPPASSLERALSRALATPGAIAAGLLTRTPPS
eukprot:2959318-Pleurochrysis_carterae.AAC.3